MLKGLAHRRRLGPTVREKQLTTDGPTDPSCRSRGADPALKRETNKIINNDRWARFSAPRPAMSTARSVDNRTARPRPDTFMSPRCSKVSPSAPATRRLAPTVREKQLTTTPLYLGDSYSVGVFVHTVTVILWDKVALSAYSESASWREIFPHLVLFIFSVNYVNKHLIIIIIIN